MRIPSLACVAALALSCAASHAESFNQSIALVPNATQAGAFSAAWGITHLLSGDFTDTFTFTGATDGLVSGGLVTIGFLPDTNIDFTSASINGVALGISNQGGLGVELASLPLTAFNGPLTLTLSGVAAPTLAANTAIAASFAGTLNVSRVPEPETLPMLLAGLGVVGLLIRRRTPG